MGSQFPKYLMIVNGKHELLPLGRAAAAYDSGLVPVSFGDLVLEKDGSTRSMTDEDKARISDAADEYSASK